MDISTMRSLVDEAIDEGFLFRSEGTVLSSAEGFNYAARAALGALLDSAGTSSFNNYCKNQKTLTGWLASKGNPINEKARTILKGSSSDPTMGSMLTDVEREFVRPLVDEHTQRGGRRPSSPEIDATSAMVVSRIIWDLSLGNPDLSQFVGMLRSASERTNPDAPADQEAGDGYGRLGASDEQANIADEISQEIFTVSFRASTYLTTTSFESSAEPVVLLAREFQYFFNFLFWRALTVEHGEWEGSVFMSLLGSIGTLRLKRVARELIGSEAPEHLNAEEFQQACADYRQSSNDIPVEVLIARCAAHLQIDRSEAIDSLVSHILMQGEFNGFQEMEFPTLDIESCASRYSAVSQ